MESISTTEESSMRMEGSNSSCPVPLIDFSSFDTNAMASGKFACEADLEAERMAAARELDEAMKVYGCFMATFDDFHVETREECFTEMKEFFKKELENPVLIPSSKFALGYNGFATESIGKFYGDKDAPNDEVAKFTVGGCGVTYTQEEILEEYKMDSPPELKHKGDHNGKTFYHTAFPNASTERVLKAAYKMGDRIGDLIFRCIAKALELEDEEYFVDRHKYKGYMRCVFYPETVRSPKMQQMRLGAHTDSSCITLLLNDQEAGLQIKLPNGEWLPVKTKHERAYFVNGGDLLVRFSNKRWRSVVHRVQWPEANGQGVIPERISMPFFVTPNPYCVVGPVSSCTGVKDTPLFYQNEVINKLMNDRFAVLLDGAKYKSLLTEERIDNVLIKNPLLNEFHKDVVQKNVY
eukprot:Nk52_evm47s2531 gene=Nk52_evmTU47s2531